MSKASEELEKEIKETKEQGTELAKTGRDFTEKGQKIVDLADATLQLNKLAPDRPNIENQISTWQNSANILRLARQGIENYMPMINSTAGTITGSSSAEYNHIFIFSELPPESRLSADVALSNIQRILDHEADEKLIIDLMVNFGLANADPGKKSPVELIQTGYKAFRGPVTVDNPISTSLIPIREAINLSIDRLLKQRPKQEEAKNEYAKITSLGKQLKRDEIPVETVDIWAHQWWRILNEILSPAKDQSIKRDEWRTRIKEVTVWFISFLEGLDSQKLRISGKR